jgi:hypothetical protein
MSVSSLARQALADLLDDEAQRHTSG